VLNSEIKTFEILLFDEKTILIDLVRSSQDPIQPTEDEAFIEIETKEISEIFELEEKNIPLASEPPHQPALMADVEMFMEENVMLDIKEFDEKYIL
jgi:hypothetical protein